MSSLAWCLQYPNSAESPGLHSYIRIADWGPQPALSQL